MNISGWIQLAFYVLVLLAITKPLGLYLVQVLDANGKTFLDPVVRPIERLTYRILGVKPDQEQNWIQYAVALLIFSVVSMIFTYGILRLQDHLPLNPQRFPAVADHLSFNTAASFTTNTNWQSYSGESTMTGFPWASFTGLPALSFFGTWTVCASTTRTVLLCRKFCGTP